MSFPSEVKNKVSTESAALSIQSFFMTSSKNNIQLSAMADNKANVLLSACSLIIGVSLTHVSYQLDQADKVYLIIPLIILLSFCIITIMLCIQIVIPKNTKGTFQEKDALEKNVNLAFFGNFHSMQLKDYEAAVADLFKNQDDIYNVLTMDMYYLGQVLDKKYRLLNLTFLIFALGFIISFASLYFSIQLQSAT